VKLTPLKKEWLEYKAVSNKAQTIQVSPNVNDKIKSSEMTLKIPHLPLKKKPSVV